MTVFKIALHCCLISALFLFYACSVKQAGEPTLTPAYVEVPYADLVLEELGQAALAYPEIPGCSLVDLRPFGWKTVDSGFVDIRSPDDYAIQVESLYQEGYQDYLQTRVEHPNKYQSIPQMSYEEFLMTCNVFPEIDFGRYSLLGAQATRTGCTVIFEKQVYRDEQSKEVIFEIAVIEEGECEMVFHNRNLILIPRIPPEYCVEYLLQSADQN